MVENGSNQNLLETLATDSPLWEIFLQKGKFKDRDLKTKIDFTLKSLIHGDSFEALERKRKFELLTELSQDLLIHIVIDGVGKIISALETNQIVKINLPGFPEGTRTIYPSFSKVIPFALGFEIGRLGLTRPSDECLRKGVVDLITLEIFPGKVEEKMKTAGLFVAYAPALVEFGEKYGRKSRGEIIDIGFQDIPEVFQDTLGKLGLDEL